MKLTQSKWRRAGQALIALGLTAAVTASLRLLVSVNITTVGFAYLLVVLAAASVFGFPEALIASLAAAAQYNFFFLPPTDTFTVDDTRNWVALAAFLITATVASELSASAKRQAREAEFRRQEIKRLYELSRASLLADPGDTALQIERALVAIFDFEDAKIELTDGATDVSGTPDLRWPLRVGQSELGFLRVKAPPISPESGAAIAGIVAIALERARVQRESSRMQGLRESEFLKTALLDSVTHDLRTPLTSIKAAVTSLLGEDLERGQEDAARRDLLAVINEESDRLNHILQNVLDMARIESGDLRLVPKALALAPIIEAAITQARLAPQRVRSIGLSDLPPVRADGPLLSQAITQLLSNAAAYSKQDSLIEITASISGAWLTAEIRDHGPGIAPEILPRIFDKFFRDPRARQSRPEGIGMGLAIARGIIQAHQGTLQAASEPGQGARFWFTLPIAVEAAYEQSCTHGDSNPHH
ncbi:MAG TPA: ATP-binding protein [Terriglobales bacterium]|nr:ATP-binding protein [Terriglobales bacterium]